MSNNLPADPGFCATGTVAYALTYAGNMSQLLVTDGRTGVNFSSTAPSAVRPVPGDIVRIEGALALAEQGDVRPEYTKAEAIGHAAPPAPHEGPAAEIMSGRHDFCRSYLVGEIRDVEPSGTSPLHNYLSVIADACQYYVPIPTRGAPLAKLESLIGAKVRLDGFPDSHNCSRRFLDERRFVISSMEDIKVLSPPPDDPFAGAPDINVLRRLAPETLPRLGRHRTEGRIISVWQERYAMLQMRDGRMAMLNFSSPSRIPRGTSVEVVGYPSTDGFFLNLSNAIARPVPGEPFVERGAEDISEEHFRDLISAEFSRKYAIQGNRLRICGTVTDFGEAQDRSKTFSISAAGHLLEVDFSSVPESAARICTGCRVRVTGTCVLATENWAVLSTDARLNGIRLVVDRPGDLEIVSRPPWWTPARLTAAIAVLAFVIAAILLWNRQLRLLSEKRGRELFRERSASALAEMKTAERTRLAADIHDSISQVLTGAAMQLDAGETSAAKRILASCRRELRACLWDLRNHALDEESFADDHQIVREGLSRLIDKEEDLEIVAEAENGLEAVRLAAELSPDLTILDLRMPQMDGATAAAKILEAAPDAKILLLTSFATAAEVKVSLDVGVLGAVVKDSSSETIIEAVRATARGEKFISPEIAAIIAERRLAPSLSERQKDILRLIAKGFNNDEIAERVGITRHGVKAHLAIIFERLGASSRTEAASLALSLDII